MAAPPPVSVVLAEDEPLIRDHLRDLIEDQEGFVVAAATANGTQAVDAVRRLQPDLLILDIEMPGMSGMDVLHALGDDAPPVVFVTAYDRYSLQAFDLHAVDYVLKPVDEDRLSQALDRAARRVRHGDLHRRNRRLVELLRDLGVEPEAPDNAVADAPDNALADAPADALADAPADAVDDTPAVAPPARISVPVRGGWVFVEVADIDWIGAAGVYVHLHVGDQQHLLRETLRTLEDHLPSPPFIRVHRSAIINADRIRSVESLSHGDYLVHLDDDTPIRVSRRYRDAIAALVRSRGDSPTPK